MQNELLNNLQKLHTTKMGAERITKNLTLNAVDAVEWCKKEIKSQEAVIVRKGKNWYAAVNGCVITINAHSCTIITAHKQKN